MLNDLYERSRTQVPVYLAALAASPHDPEVAKGLAGLWAEKFDHLAAVQNFVVMPMTFLSGTFYMVSNLPEPFATPSATNFPSVVPKPADAELKLPPGFSRRSVTRATGMKESIGF